MKTQDSSQLELFSEVKGDLALIGRKKYSIFTAMRGYEKNILVIIAFIVTAIVAFALGVEKGKSPGTVVQPVATLPRSEVRAASAVAAQNKQLSYQPPALSGVKAAPQRFTVQVATYKNVKYAQQEAESLKKRGVTTAVVPRGEYFVLYAGNFLDMEQASSFLYEIKKQKNYTGAVIRRL